MQHQLSLFESQKDGVAASRSSRLEECLPSANDRLFDWCGQCERVEHSREALVEELLRIHDYERQRMGQELHDSAGQLLVALQLSVAHLREVEKESGHETLIDDVQDIIRQIDRQIRALAFLHYPAELDERGLSSAIERLVRGFDRRTGIHTRFRVSGEVDELGEAASEALLRVAQEALVNIHRHAHASAAKVELERRAREVRLSVSDNGIGLSNIDASRLTKGVGLQSMMHRLQVLSGKLKIRGLSHGLKIVATIPT